MPPKKRALEEADANAQPAAKRTSTGKASKKAPEEPAQDQDATEDAAIVADLEECDCPTCSGKDPLKGKKPEEYICVIRPLFDFVAEKGDNDEAYEEHNKAVKGPNKMWPKSPADHPDWKWVMMVKSWKDYCEFGIKQDYVDPESFDMYVFNDFHGYGLNEMIQDTIVEFNKEYSKKKNRSVHRTWAIMATLGHWLNDNDNLMTWLQIDDGEQVNQFVALIGCAFLSALDALDQAGHLKPESEFLDLGLVMSLWLSWSCGLEDYGIGDDGDELEWRQHIVEYAKKAGIDLKASGCHGTFLTKSLEQFKDVEPLKNAKAGRWQWPKNYKDFHGQYISDTFMPYNLPGYDITKWDGDRRAKWNFDKVDPLADIPEKDLKENNIMLA